MTGLNVGSARVQEGSKDRLRNGSLEVNTTSEKAKPKNFDTTDIQTGGNCTRTENSLDISGGIKITDITAKWTDDLPENTLTDVSLNVRPGGLMAIIGPVGSGKVS